MGGPQYKRSKSFSLQGSHMTSRHPLGKQEIGPSYGPHMPPLGKQTQAYITLFNLCFYATPFAKNVLFHLNDKM